MIFREQKRHIRKNHIKFLKNPSMAGCPRNTRPVSPAKFFYSKQQEVPGTPAGRPLFVPPGVPRTPGSCPEDFLKFLCLPRSPMDMKIMCQGQNSDEICAVFQGCTPEVSNDSVVNVGNAHSLPSSSSSLLFLSVSVLPLQAWCLDKLCARNFLECDHERL